MHNGNHQSYFVFKSSVIKIAFPVSTLHEEIYITKGKILTETHPQLAAAAKMMYFKILLGTLMICKVIEGNLGEKSLGATTVHLSC